MVNLKLETNLEKIDIRTKFGKLVKSSRCGRCGESPITHSFCLDTENTSRWQMYLCFECAHELEFGEHSSAYEREVMA